MLIGIKRESKLLSGYNTFVFPYRRAEAGDPFVIDIEITECAYWPVDSLPRPLSNFTELCIRDVVTAQPVLLPVVFGPRRWLA